MKMSNLYPWCALAVISLISCACATTEWVRVDETDHFIFSATNGRVADEAVPSISTDLVPDRFHQAGGLAFSITLVEYMIEQYGFEEIIAIIKAPLEVETILGITLSDLDLAWREYLREAYPYRRRHLSRSFVPARHETRSPFLCQEHRAGSGRHCH
jgi:hypothetical protein